MFLAEGVTAWDLELEISRCLESTRLWDWMQRADMSFAIKLPSLRTHIVWGLPKGDTGSSTGGEGIDITC